MNRYSAIVDRTAEGPFKVQFVDNIDGGQCLTRETVLGLWKSDDLFCKIFSDSLADLPMAAYFWETPVLSAETLHLSFECMVTDAPKVARQGIDPAPFQNQLDLMDTAAGVIAFRSLGGDADLVVPRDIGEGGVYAHLASFVRTAPPRQVRNLWQVVAEMATRRLGNGQRLWTSTAGLGVAWLHVRLDSGPKYYRHNPYRSNE